MTNLLESRIVLIVASWLFFSAGIVRADDPTPGGSATAKPSPLSGLLDLLGSTAIPSLSGLIQPEKMGVLTDNPLTVRDNPVEVELLSGNETNFLSGNRFLSGITVNVQIHIHPSPRPRGEGRADRSDRKQKPEKPPARKASRP
jgi:hypothetical protein